MQNKNQRLRLRVIIRPLKQCDTSNLRGGYYKTVFIEVAWIVARNYFMSGILDCVNVQYSSRARQSD